MPGGHGGARSNAGRKKGGRNQNKLGDNQTTLEGIFTKNDKRKKGKATITVEEANRKREREQEEAEERLQRDRQRKKKEQEKEQQVEEERARHRARLEAEAAEGTARLREFVEGAIENNNVAGGGGDGGDDDDDDGDHSDDEEDCDIDEDTTESAPGTRASAKCKPPKNSKLGQHLEEKKNDIAGKDYNLCVHAGEGTVWFPPVSSAIEQENTDPMNHCIEKPWI